MRNYLVGKGASCILPTDRAVSTLRMTSGENVGYLYLWTVLSVAV